MFELSNSLRIFQLFGPTIPRSLVSFPPSHAISKGTSCIPAPCAGTSGPGDNGTGGSGTSGAAGSAREVEQVEALVSS